jgi:hypothetical protein
MEPIDIINLIDDLKTIYHTDHMQDRLNVWKDKVIKMDMNNEWNSLQLKSELESELVIIKSILQRIKE